jgi:hypothetical protein
MLEPCRQRWKRTSQLGGSEHGSKNVHGEDEQQRRERIPLPEPSSVHERVPGMAVDKYLRRRAAAK